ncbi:MAG: hypothetical protein GX585_00170 [Clostridiales bacterium]|nr:hypothetical protein [Clostridiales bacterium]
MRSKGYSSYRGASRLRKALKFVIVLLLAVLILGLCALLIFPQYVVYSADGPRLELPFLGRGKETPPPAESAPPASPTLPVVVVTPEVTAPEALHVVILPRSALSDGTAAEQMAAAGGNAVLFDMKADDGSLGYVSGLPLAISARASSGDPDVNAAITALNGTGDLYTVARVSCFKDDLLSNADRALNILTNSGYRWTDPEGLKWSSPTAPAVRDYVTGVCVELAQLGFDEILLDWAGYPTEGNLHYIKKGEAYDSSAFAAVIEDFYAQTAEALAAHPGVKLAIVTDGATVTDGVNSLSGQSVAALAAYAQRVWLSPSADVDAVSAFASAGLTDAETNVVFMGGAPGEEGESWAIPAIAAES